MAWNLLSTVLIGELDMLDRELGDLESCNASEEEVQKRVGAVLAQLPAPEKVESAPVRARVLCLRCRAQLVRSHVSAEAERDCHAALKLKPDNAVAWILLSECLLRRNACKDACDALDSALRFSPSCTAALCQYSQVQRNRSSERGLSLAQRTAYLRASVEKARSAIRSNMNSGYAWYMLSLALLAMMTVDGVSVVKLRKAAAAIAQAERKTVCCVYNSVGGGEEQSPCDSSGDKHNSTNYSSNNSDIKSDGNSSHGTGHLAACGNADVMYNKAVMKSLLGYFADAAVSYARAHALDCMRLKGTRYLSLEMAGILEHASNRMKNIQGMGKREYVKLQARLSRWQSGAGGEDRHDGNKHVQAPSPNGNPHSRRVLGNGDVQHHGDDCDGEASGKGSGACDTMATQKEGTDKHRSAFVVVDVLSKATMQPLVLLVSELSGEFSFVLIYEVSSTLFKIGDIITLPHTETGVQVRHHIPKLVLPGTENEELELTMRHYYTVRDQVQLNNKALPSSAKVPLQMSSRLFA